MKLYPTISLMALLLFSCKSSPRLNGSWQLVSGTTIARGVATVTDFTKRHRMIKILNDTHFAFFADGLAPLDDTSNHFYGGGGRYTLSGDQYTESLDYCSDHNWQGKKYVFTVSFKGDTLIQQGREKLEWESIDREIIERYVRVK